MGSGKRLWARYVVHRQLSRTDMGQPVQPQDTGNLTSNSSSPAFSFGQVLTLLRTSVFSAVKWTAHRCEYWDEVCKELRPRCSSQGWREQMWAGGIWRFLPWGWHKSLEARAGLNRWRQVPTRMLYSQVRLVVLGHGGEGATPFEKQFTLNEGWP